MRPILLELPNAQVVPCTCKCAQRHGHYCPMFSASMLTSIAAGFHSEDSAQDKVYMKMRSHSRHPALQGLRGKLSHLW